MSERFYRPKIKDSKGIIQKRTKQIAKNCGLRLELLQTKIFETGLIVYENNTNEIFKDDIKNK